MSNAIFASAGRAAKVHNVDSKALLQNYRNFKAAPKELKPALLTMYRIMRGYRKAPAAAIEAE